MTWQISVSEDAKQFLKGLDPEEGAEVNACIKLLRELGPNLRRPYSGTLRGSKYSNLKELRIAYKRKQFRVLYALDTEQCAILLVGGDKVPMGEKLWYRKFIARAEELYEEHERGLTEKRNETTAVKTKSRNRGAKRGAKS